MAYDSMVEEWWREQNSIEIEKTKEVCGQRGSWKR